MKQWWENPAESRWLSWCLWEGPPAWPRAVSGHTGFYRLCCAEGWVGVEAPCAWRLPPFRLPPPRLLLGTTSRRSVHPGTAGGRSAHPGTASGWSARLGTASGQSVYQVWSPRSLRQGRAPGKCKAVPTFEKGVCHVHVPRDDRARGSGRSGPSSPRQGQSPCLREGLPGGSPAWHSAPAHALILARLPDWSTCPQGPPRCRRHQEDFSDCWQHLPDFGMSTALGLHCSYHRHVPHSL